MDFSKTYLYKLHKLTNTLDKAFDQTLRNHTNIGLSQLSLLLAINQYETTNQQQLSVFLGITPPAISRQVELAARSGYITITPSVTDRNGRTLALTTKGKTVIDTSLKALENHLFKIFDDDNQQTHLMDHIDRLLIRTKEVVDEQAALKR